MTFIFTKFRNEKQVPDLGRRLFLFFAAFFLLILTPHTAWSNDKDDVNRHLVVRGDSNYKPYEFLENGVPTGFNVELFKAVAEAMGLNVEIRLGPWSEVRADLENGNIDALTGMYYSEERDKLVDFSSPFVIVSHAIFVQKGSRIESIDDIKGMEIIVQKGDIMHDFVLEQNISDKIYPVEDQLEAIRLLSSGKHDCALLGKLQVLYLANKLKIDNIKAVGPPIEPRKYCFAVREGDEKLLAVLNEGLGIIKASNAYNDIYYKWFGEYEKIFDVEKALKWVAIIAVPLLVLLGAAFLWTWYLRKVVNEKTAELQVELTERKQAQAALADSEERFRALAEQAPFGIMISQKDNRAVYLNPKYIEILGYTLQDMPTGENYWKTLYPDPEYRAEVYATWIQDFSMLAQDINPGSRVFRVRCKDGLDKMIKYRAAYLQKDMHLVTLEDVTAQMIAEDALRSAEEKYRSIFENALEGIFRMNPDGGIVDANPVLAGIFGFGSVAEFLNEATENPDRIYLYPEKMREMLNELERQGFVKEFELETKKADGSTGVVSISAITAKDKNGDIQHLEGFILDISQRKEAEKIREKLQEQLNQSQKMEAVGTLASGIAHDFNNILQALSGYLELAKIEGFGSKLAGDMEAAVNRAAELVKRLLTFGRKVKPHLGYVELNKEVGQITAMLERTIPKMIGIRTKLALDLKPIAGDPNQLEQVIVNLANNARDAMPDGGSLSIETKNIILDDVSTQGIVDLKPGEYVLLSVSDTGCGMDKETIRHIFEPFFTTKGVGKGTGIGLSTVYGIVKGHQGHITCYSEPEVGTTFNVYLPVSHLRPVQAEIKKIEQKKELPRGNETILVVDDEGPIKDVAEKILQLRGFKTLSAESGEEALEMYRNPDHKIDLIVLDLGMPGMGGRACLRKLLAVNPSLKVIVASGYASESQEEQILKDGAKKFVKKPYRLPELLGAVRDVLDNHNETAG